MTSLQIHSKAMKIDRSWSREQYHEQYRQWRNDNPAGGIEFNYDNSHIWNLRNQIAAEILPEIVRRQRAWANMV